MKGMLSASLVLALTEYRNHIIASYHAMGSPEQSTRSLFDIQFEAGSKYIRVFSVSYGSRSCHSFIEIETGFIWKAASWKAPAKNFSRGSVYHPNTWVNIRWTGI